MGCEALAGGGAPGPGGLPMVASCACADSASNDMAEATGMMIFIRLDARIGAYPFPLDLVSQGCCE
jgi:hypothetical protein